MPDRAFFDTNILIYAFSAGDPRQGVALKLMLNGGAIGVQTLNEFVSVATCKLKIPWTEVVARLGIIERLCDPAVPVTLSVHRRGPEISQVSVRGQGEGVRVGLAMRYFRLLFTVI